MTYIREDRMHMERDLPKIFSKAMKFYDEMYSLYLEKDAIGIGLGAELMQGWDGMTCPWDEAPHNNILRPIAFTSKSLSLKERYSNIEREASGILCGMEKFHHYCFAREVSISADYKSLVASLRKDVATLLQRLQCILLQIHQYRIKIIYKPGSDLFIAD